MYILFYFFKLKRGVLYLDVLPCWERSRAGEQDGVGPRQRQLSG